MAPLLATSRDELIEWNQIERPSMKARLHERRREEHPFNRCLGHLEGLGRDLRGIPAPSLQSRASSPRRYPLLSPFGENRYPTQGSVRR